MYPVERVYSHKAYMAWRSGEAERSGQKLKHFKQTWRDVSGGPFWDVATWAELRTAVSFLTLMNKRDVLYFRGQGEHHARCLPVLFRPRWFLRGRSLPLRPDNRGRYYALLSELGADVLRVAKRIGMPRTYILEHVASAAASILQHYELWPTHFIDVTRSLPTALAFAEGDGGRTQAYLYVFAMPDLRGSITSDIDQQLSLARLEAICPPAATRPHDQDAYLVARFPEPRGAASPGDIIWDDWQRKTDLMRRLVAKFSLTLQSGRLPGAPRLELSFLAPPFENDPFGKALHDSLLPTIERYVAPLT